MFFILRLAKQNRPERMRSPFAGTFCRRKRALLCDFLRPTLASLSMTSLLFWRARNARRIHEPKVWTSIFRWNGDYFECTRRCQFMRHSAESFAFLWFCFCHRIDSHNIFIYSKIHASRVSNRQQTTICFHFKWLSAWLDSKAAT